MEEMYSVNKFIHLSNKYLIPTGTVLGSGIIEINRTKSLTIESFFYGSRERERINISKNKPI